MRNYEAAIFDMDGLLLDSERLALETFQATCSSFGLGDFRDVFMKCIGTNSSLGQSILRKGLDGQVDYEEFSAVWDTAYKAVSDNTPIPLKKGTKDVLTYFHSRRIPMAVATSTKTDSARKKLQTAGILDFFTTLIGGDQVQDSKPAPQIYLKAAAALSIDPARCVAFEDSSNGVKAAVAAGMMVIQIPDLIEPDASLLALGHTVHQSLADALTLEFLADEPSE